MVSKLNAPAATLLTLGYSYGGGSNNGNPVSHTVNGALMVVQKAKSVTDETKGVIASCGTG
jgi:hypothetical protein